MNIEARLAILEAACVRANIRAIGMQAENISRVHRGEHIAYNEDAFIELITEEGISHNQVMEWITR